MNFSVNAHCLFGKTPLDQAFAVMKRLGYTVFEHWQIAPADVDHIAACLGRYDITLSTFCTDYFTLNDEGCHDAYEAALINALETAGKLHCLSLITQVGQDTGKPRSAQHDAIVKGLMRVKPHLEKANVLLLVEPLNDVKDHKGYYLTSSQEGFDIIREVNSPNIKLLFDVYHQLHMGEDVIACIADHLDLIGHFHIAGFPDRDDKLFECYDYRPLLVFLNEQKVEAPVGLELFPGSMENTEAVLKALQPYLNDK